MQKVIAFTEWMVDHCDEVIACWDGSSKGTKQCLDYAEKMGKVIHYTTPIVESK